MSTVMVPNSPMFSLWAGQMWARISSSMASWVAELPHGQAEILGGPGADGVGRDGQTPRLFGLVLKVASADGAFVGVEHVAAQRVDALALVELAGDLAAVVVPGQIPGGVDRATEQPVLLERGGQGVLPGRRGRACPRSVTR